MFSVLTATSTGGLYVPAIYIAFLRRLYFLAVSSKPILCPAGQSLTLPLQSLLLSTAPFLTGVISDSGEPSARRRITLLRSTEHSIINDSVDDGGTFPKTFQKNLPPSELLGRLFLPWRLNLVNQAIVSGCLSVHEVIAFRVPSHFFYRLTRVVGQNVV